VADTIELPLEDAARHLGISTEALRKRVKRGKTIDGFTRDGRWYVRVPDTAGDTSTETASHEPATDEPRPDAAAMLLEALQTENAFLRGQIGVKDAELADRTREISELHVLLQREQSRSLAAPREDVTSQAADASEPRRASSNGTAPIEEQETTVLPRYEAQKRPWWRFWKG
jgi:hypothetical protein